MKRFLRHGRGLRRDEASGITRFVIQIVQSLGRDMFLKKIDESGKNSCELKKQSRQTRIMGIQSNIGQVTALKRQAAILM